MPTVPRYEEQVRTEPLRLPNAQPESFGGGAIAQGLGQAADFYARAREESARLVEDEAEVELMGVTRALDREFTQLRGKTAIEGADSIFERFEKESHRIEATLPAARRQRYAVVRQRRRVELEHAVAQHADKEEQAEVEATRTARFAYFTEQATKAAREGRIEESNDYIAQARQLIADTRTSTRSPWRSDEEADGAEAALISAMHLARIEGLFAQELPEQAAALITAAGDALTEKDREAVMGGQLRLNEQQKIDRAYTEAMAITDPTKRAEYIAGLTNAEGNADTSLQRAVRSFVKEKLDADRQIEGDARVELMREYDQARVGNPLMTPQQYFRDRQPDLTLLGADAVEVLRSSSGKFDDDQTWAQFLEVMRVSPEALAAMPADEFYSRWGRRLSAHRGDAERYYEALRLGNARGANPGAVSKAQGLISENERAALVAERFGLKLPAEMAKRPNLKGKLEAWERRYSAFRTAADRAVLAESQKLGRALSDMEKQVVLEDVALSQIRIDRNKNAGAAKAAIIESDLEDEVVFGLDAALRLTPEDRLRAYIPTSAAAELHYAGGVSMLDAARNVLASKGRTRYSDFFLMRIAAELSLFASEERITALIEAHYGK